MQAATASKTKVYFSGILNQGSTHAKVSIHVRILGWYARTAGQMHTNVGRNAYKKILKPLDQLVKQFLATAYHGISLLHVHVHE